MRFAVVLMAVWSIVRTSCAAEDDNAVLRATWSACDITPEVGTLLAGYGSHDVSVGVRDPLELRVLAVSRGGDRVLLMTYDLLGIDDAYIKKIRRRCADAFGAPESRVLLSCTHTHGGPHTRAHWVGGKWVLDDEYLQKLIARSEETVIALRKRDEWHACRLGFHSRSVDLNRNRRYTTADNCASFIPHLRALYGLPGGIVDKELGTIVLLDADTGRPRYVIGNYAAHPLASHAPGRGGLMITADYPGVYRKTILEDTGAEAMFINGAAGDVVPVDDELGFSGMRDMGERLARASVASLLDIQRNQKRFVFGNPRLDGSIRSFETRIRDCWRKRLGYGTKTLEVQCLALGDVAFVGVPGEIVNELGLEIKWHSPFKRTFIAYLSTGYFDYMLQPSLLAAGGYEAQGQRYGSRDTLRLVQTASDALFELRDRLHPEDSTAGGDAYPDNLKSPIVNLPGGLKMPKGDSENKPERD